MSRCWSTGTRSSTTRTGSASTWTGGTARRSSRLAPIRRRLADARVLQRFRWIPVGPLVSELSLAHPADVRPEVLEWNVPTLRDAAEAHERHHLVTGVAKPLDLHLDRSEDLQIAVPCPDHRFAAAVGRRSGPLRVLDVLDLRMPPALGGRVIHLHGGRAEHLRPHSAEDFEVSRAHGGQYPGSADGVYTICGDE